MTSDYAANEFGGSGDNLVDDDEIWGCWCCGEPTAAGEDYCPECEQHIKEDNDEASTDCVECGRYSYPLDLCDDCWHRSF